MRPPLASIAPWLFWGVSSLVLAMEPQIGSAIYVLAALWLCLALCRSPTLKVRRLLLLVAVPAPAIVILLRRLPALEDVGVILAPFYFVPAAVAVVAAFGAGLYIGLCRPSN
jgi:hypothetical protein